MKIYLTRHGETTGDIEDRYGGDYDDHLSDRGKQNAKLLSEKLRNKGIQVIYHSTRIRAAEMSAFQHSTNDGSSQLNHKNYTWNAEHAQVSETLCVSEHTQKSSEDF